ncbi:MAG TPA: hypothetical protein VFP41_02220 [Actinomycetota bacterium]|nr:hypothetical protein [Actinomycetota bacterium]
MLLAVALAAGAAMTMGSPRASEPRSRGPIEAAPSVPVVTRNVPRYGDCGADDGAGVEPVACSDRRANVEVGAGRALGDPTATCPLYDRRSVLATSTGVGSLYLCWVPIGGGPSRHTGTPEFVEAATTEPKFVAGTCGDVHDQHVHAPLSCEDQRADGVVTIAAPEASQCPEGTLLALPAATGSVVCWGPR